MRLSIIVPVYNVEQYLDKCVESILDQIFSDYSYKDEVGSEKGHVFGLTEKI